MGGTKECPTVKMRVGVTFVTLNTSFSNRSRGNLRLSLIKTVS